MFLNNLERETASANFGLTSPSPAASLPDPIFVFKKPFCKVQNSNRSIEIRLLDLRGLIECLLLMVSGCVVAGIRG
ncbi:hypothetical protein L1987_44251 [Smallanthus sonchifolius]|uniref:Uncharacterized protein n=1 Tax=Smallanthus sonchifolius TaxID=185202 RepID=A0ACB9GNP2_9ASTR|nr:hypothetical protein L1987_44251 [Smallanthus sonchifolius]